MASLLNMTILDPACCCFLRSCRFRCPSLIRALDSGERFFDLFARVSSRSQLFRADSLGRALCSGENCLAFCTALNRARVSGERVLFRSAGAACESLGPLLLDPSVDRFGRSTGIMSGEYYIKLV